MAKRRHCLVLVALAATAATTGLHMSPAASAVPDAETEVEVTPKDLVFWDVGNRVSGPSLNWDDYVPGAKWYDDPTQLETIGGIKKHGDYVYVFDDSAGSRDSLVEWQMHEEPYSSGYCVNESGDDTWVRCDLNWPEGMLMSFRAGVYDDGQILVGSGGSARIYFRNNQ